MNAAHAPNAVVVAHPDDEILWLSSVLGAADRVVFCFGDPFGNPAMARARRRAVAALALPGLIDLALPESGAGFSVDRADPVLTATGLAITNPEAGARYDANFATLVTSLRPVLVGCAFVYTHNPWGEYGHAEHVQVYRAVRLLQAELGFTLGFSNYVAAASLTLARRLAEQSVWTQRRTLPTDLALARRLRRVYLCNRAWTWTRWHRWPAVETLYLSPPDGASDDRQTLSGEALLDVAGLRWLPPSWRSSTRLLTLEHSFPKGRRAF